MNARSQKNVDVECLRAIAIFLVVLQHYRNRLPTPRFYYGMFDYIQPWTGVDIFLAVSGFLVTKTLIEHIGKEPLRDALLNFWKRRIARLLPAFGFWALISVSVAASVAASPAQGIIDAAKGALVGLLGIANIYWTLCAQHGFTCVGHDYNSHFWSLALEWQLYAGLVVLVALLKRRIAIAALLAFAVIASCFPAPGFSWAWSLRPQAFILGSMTYFSYEKLSARKGRTVAKWHGNVIFKQMCLASGVCISIVAPICIPEPFTIPVVSIGSTIALISTLGAGSSFPPRTSAVLEWIGARSYSIYLCHLSIIYALQKTLLVLTNFTNPSSGYLFAASFVVLLALTVFLADLSYRHIEQPARRWLSPVSAVSTR